MGAANWLPDHKSSYGEQIRGGRAHGVSMEVREKLVTWGPFLSTSPCEKTQFPLDSLIVNNLGMILMLETCTVETRFGGPDKEDKDVSFLILLS